jgi:hypothetical protein
VTGCKIQTKDSLKRAYAVVEANFVRQNVARLNRLLRLNVSGVRDTHANAIPTIFPPEPASANTSAGCAPTDLQPMLVQETDEETAFLCSSTSADEMRKLSPLA